VLLFAASENMLGQSICTKKSGTLATLSVVRNGLKEYNLTFGSFPPTLQALVQAKIFEPGKIRDGWQRPLMYQPLSERLHVPFLLFSVGPDGIPLTPDDVTLADPLIRQKPGPASLILAKTLPAPIAR